MKVDSSAANTSEVIGTVQQLTKMATPKKIRNTAIDDRVGCGKILRIILISIMRGDSNIRKSLEAIFSI